MQQIWKWPEKLSSWDFVYALDMAIACFISYSVTTHVLWNLAAKPDAFLGGMWATPLKDLSVGLAVQNLGTPIKLKREAFDLPAARIRHVQSLAGNRYCRRK